MRVHNVECSPTPIKKCKNHIWVYQPERAYNACENCEAVNVRDGYML